MAVVKNLMVRAGADFSAITKQAKKASDSMKGLSNTVSSAAGAMKRALGAVGAAVSIAAIVSAAKDAAAAYNQQAEAEAKLAQVMKNTMGASSAEVKSIKELTAAQQALGVVGDEVQLAGAQMIATHLRQTSSLKKLIPAMNDVIAHQYGYNATVENAEAVGKAFGKALEGQTGALTRYGYTMTDAQQQMLKYGNEEQRAAALAEVVEASVGGMNAALANTPTGRMAQLRNTLSDIKESFGQAVMTIATTFLPLLNRVASMLASIAAIANRVAQAIANVFGKKISSGTAVAASGIGAASDAMGNLADSSKSAGKAAKEAAKSVLSFDVLNKLSDNKTADTDTGGGVSVPDSDIGMIGGLADAEDEAAESSTWLENVLTRIRDLIASLNFEPLRAAVARLKEAFGALAEVIGGALSWAFDNVLTPLAHWTIEKWWPALIEELAAQWEFLAAALKAVKPFALWIWENFLKPLAEWTGEAVVNALNDLKEVFEGLADVLEGKTTISEFLKDLSPSQTVILALLGAAGAISAISGAIRGIKSAVTIAKGAFALLSGSSLPVIAIFAVIAAAAIAIYQNWDSVKAKLQEGWEDLKGDFERLKDGFAAVGELIKEAWTGLQEHWENVKAKFKEGWEDLKGDWKSLKNSFVAFGILIKAAWTGLQEHWENIKAKFKEGWEEIKGDWQAVKDSFAAVGDLIKAVWTGLQEHWETIKAAFKEGWEEIKCDWQAVKDSFAAVGDLIKAVWTGLQEHWNSIKEGLAESWEALKEAWTSFKDALATVGEAIKTGWTGLLTKWTAVKVNIANKIEELRKKWDDFKDKFGAAKDAIVNFANNLWTSISTPFSNIVSKIDNIISKCSEAINWLDSLSAQGEARIEANGGLWFPGMFASGGWPDVGQLFLAREAGPELVGTIGGQTAVANNQDIVAAVSAGVAQAVAQVLNSSRGGGSKQPIVLNINGREFARATYGDYQAVNNERGISLVNA